MDDLLLCQPSKNNTDCRLGSAENYHRLWWFNSPVFAGACVLDRKGRRVFLLDKSLSESILHSFFPQKLLTLIKPSPCLCRHTVFARLLIYERETGLFLLIRLPYIIFALKLWKRIIVGHPRLEFWPLGGILTRAAVRLEPKFRGGLTSALTRRPVLSE